MGKIDNLSKDIDEEELVPYIKSHEELKKALFRYETDLLDNNL